VNMPDDVREDIRQKLWDRADAAGWESLSDQERARYYALWTEDAEIGATLARYIPKGKVRVYIKDTLLKPYMRTRMSSPDRAFRVLGLDPSEPIVYEDIKPHGRTLVDGRVVSWASASEWRHALMAVHERAAEHGRRPYGVVLSQATGRFADPDFRRIVQSAAEKLGIEKLAWLET
jgi:hypothetical protein